MIDRTRRQLRLPLTIQQPAAFPIGTSLSEEAGLELAQEPRVRAEAAADLLNDEADTLDATSLYK